MISDGEAGQFNTVMDIEFVHDPILVTVDGLGGEVHGFGDFFDGQAEGKLFEDFNLSDGKIVPASAGFEFVAGVFGVEVVDAPFLFMREDGAISHDLSEAFGDFLERLRFEEIAVEALGDGSLEVMLGELFSEDDNTGVNVQFRE